MATVTVYSVTSVHPVYSAVTAEQHHKVSTELLLLNATRIKKIELRCLLVEALTNIKCIKSFYISLDHLQATSQQTTAKTYYRPNSDSRKYCPSSNLTNSY